MGKLVDGIWRQSGHETASNDGRFVRPDSAFRNWVTKDGGPGPSGRGGFQAEAGRYHLYVSLACPWAHRTLIMRELKGLRDLVSVSAVNAHMGRDGWTFEPGPGVIPDAVNGASRLHEIYTQADAHFTGRVTVPVLWDKRLETMVSNESAEILRMFNSAFDGVGAEPGDFYPAELRTQIDELNDYIYTAINNGVYRAGFAGTQSAYDEAVADLFAALDQLEERLATHRYLCGDHITEADWRLFTTLIRFDPVYVGHFKCNVRRLRDYPNLWGYTCDLYQQPGIAATVDIPHIKSHYYGSHADINPTGIVPRGPDADYSMAHGRDRLVTLAAAG
ncbi:MAG: glutathione S-transferase family protein [Gammaproteobacteria bacterium]|nr:glutathione S-transferase family protein [Gammaproteobacteria bacterium]MBT8443840.1 glutathione S-transferase family protein [Gammaproteobacteria bacterium]